MNYIMRLRSAAEARYPKSRGAIAASAELTDHFVLLEKGLAFVANTVERSSEASDHQKAIRILGVRLHHAGFAAWELIAQCYYQRALTQIRDVAETTHLLDVFDERLDLLKEWLENRSDPRFRPSGVRKLLAERNPSLNEGRKKRYALFSEYATHPTVGAMALTVPARLLTVAPSLDDALLKACMWELSSQLAHGALALGCHFEVDFSGFSETAEALFQEIKEWSDKYGANIPTALSPDRL